jgi:hypothetical protein
MVLDGRNAPTQVIDVVNCPNSVNPKTNGHGNTEPSINSNEFKACVENIQAASIWKKISSELRGNSQNQPEMCWSPIKGGNIFDHLDNRRHNRVRPHGWLHCQHEHIRHDCDGYPRPGLHTHFISYSHPVWSSTMPLYEVIRILNFPNSVKAKALSHANTEPSMRAISRRV